MSVLTAGLCMTAARDRLPGNRKRFTLRLRVENQKECTDMGSTAVTICKGGNEIEKMLFKFNLFTWIDVDLKRVRQEHFHRHC